MRAMTMAFCLCAAASVAAGKVSQEEIDRLAGQVDMPAKDFVTLAKRCEKARLPAMRELQRLAREAKTNGDGAQASAFERHRGELADRTQVAFPVLAKPLKDGSVGALPDGAAVVRKVVSNKSLLAEPFGWGEEPRVLIANVSTDGVKESTYVPSKSRSVGTFGGTRAGGLGAAPQRAGRGEMSFFRSLDGFRVGMGTHDGSAIFKLEPIDAAPIAEYLRLMYGKKSK
jgi:hypothetical protein